MPSPNEPPRPAAAPAAATVDGERRRSADAGTPPANGGARSTPGGELPAAAPIPWRHIRNVLVLFAPLWVGSAVLFTLIGVTYAIFRRDTYAARIGIVVRDEATTSVDRLGRFPSQTELKAAQETTLQMVTNRETIRDALRTIGPPPGVSGDGYPSDTVLTDVADGGVNLLAPSGAEFGNTEVVFLQTKSSSRERAVRFADAMYDSLAAQLRHVRSLRADSMIEELQHARDTAAEALAKASESLHEIEVRFGEDLSDLRHLRDTISGDGANRRSLEQIENSIQTAEVERRRMETLREILNDAVGNPARLLSVGAETLAGHPSLSRMKDGLVDAQLAASQLAGRYQEGHPKLLSARATESEIRSAMRQESRAASGALTTQIRLQDEELVKLHHRRDQVALRLSKLADFRLQYAALDAEVKQRTETLTAAQKRLGEAIAARSAAMNTNLIARVGPAQVGEKPLGAGGVTVAGGSIVAGLAFGLGVVFLVAPGPTSPGRGRRWSDYLTQGRRMSDRV